MVRDRFQLAGNAAAIYEEQKVPAIFSPLAEATLNAVPLSEDDLVLDVACGTGIIARQARERIGPAARIVGVDLNQGMIDVVRNLPDPLARSCEWQVADVADLPFDDGAFSVAFCQQGLQFFPDEEAALREIGRVLRPRGRIALTVWAGASDLFKALANSLRRHVGDSVADRSLAPFSYAGVESLEPRMSQLGFANFSSRLLTVDRIIRDPELAIPKEIMGNPIGPDVAEKGEAAMCRIVNEVVEALSEYREGSNLVVPQHAHLIQATVG